VAERELRIHDADDAMRTTSAMDVTVTAAAA